MTDISSYQEGYVDGFDDAKKKYQRPHGKWKITPLEHGNRVKCCFCPSAWTEPFFDGWNYCPNCGAHMKGEEE